MNIDKNNFSGLCPEKLFLTLKLLPRRGNSFK